VLSAFDSDKSGKLNAAEAQQGFAGWFSGWDADKDGLLTDPELRAGIDRDLAPRGGPGGFPPPRAGDAPPANQQ
jgi:hypothetical protein